MELGSDLLGVALIMYGLLKVVVGLLVVVLPANIRDAVAKIKYIRPFLDDDKTLAGKLNYSCMILFGVFTILFGLGALGFLSQGLVAILHSRTLNLVLYAVIGVVLTVFYYMVCFTSLPISKDMTHIDRYLIEGLVLGLSFVTSVPLMIMYFVFINGGMKAIRKHMLLFAACALIVSYNVCWMAKIVYAVTQHSSHTSLQRHVRVLVTGIALVLVVISVFYYAAEQK